MHTQIIVEILVSLCEVHWYANVPPQFLADILTSLLLFIALTSCFWVVQCIPTRQCGRQSQLPTAESRVGRKGPTELVSGAHSSTSAATRRMISSDHSTSTPQQCYVQAPAPGFDRLLQETSHGATSQLV